MIATHSHTQGSIGAIEGEELFITGKEVQVYLPRQEHFLISYDAKS